MNQTDDLYMIPLQTLKEGKFDEEWKIGKEFIEEQKVEGVFGADLIVYVHFVKQSNLHTLSLQMQGTVMVECDRCLDIFPLPITAEQNLVIKIGEKDDELADAENVMVIAPETTEIHLSQTIYEMILLALPLQKVHPKLKDCNAEMLSYLKKSAKKTKEEKTDPRWDSLKKLKIK